MELSPIRVDQEVRLLADQDGQDSSLPYELFEPESGASSSRPSRFSKWRSPRRLALAGTLGVAVVAAVVCAVLLRPNGSSGGESNVDSDNRATEQLYQDLSRKANASNGHLTFDTQSMTDDSWSTIFALLRAPAGFEVNGAVVKLAGDASTQDEGRSHVHVHGASGHLLGNDSHVDVDMHVHDGELHVVVRVQPQPASGKRNLRGDDDVLPKIPGFALVNPVYLACSHPSRDEQSGLNFDQGLSMMAASPLSQDTSPYLDIFRQMLQNKSVALMVYGLLHPFQNLSVTGGMDYDVHFGSYVTLTNITIAINASADYAGASATLIVSPPSSDNLTIALNGTLDAKNKVFSLAGKQIGTWVIPGRVQGLSLEAAVANITVHYGGSTPPNATSSSSDISIQGVVGAGIDYGKLRAYLRLSLPYEKQGFALEAVVTDQFNLADVANLPSAFPRISAVQGALVFSCFEGTYTFSAPNAPVPSMPVVKGLNFLAQLNLANTPALQPIKAVQNPPDGQVNVHGYVSTKGDFLLTGDLTNLVINDDLTFTNANLTIASAQPYCTIGASLTIKGSVIDSDQPVHFTVSAVVATQLSFRASLDGHWVLPIGKASLQVDDAWFDLEYNTATKAFSGLLRADVELFGQNLTAKLQYPAPYSANDNRCVDFELDDFGAVPVSFLKILHDAVDADTANNAQNMDVHAQALDQLLNGPLSNVEFYFAPRCGNISLSADADSAIFGTARVGIEIVQPQGESWHFQLYLVPEKSWSLSSCGLVNGNFPRLVLQSPAFLLSSAPGNITIVDSISGSNFSITFDAKTGLNIKAVLMVESSEDMTFVKQMIPEGTTEVDISGTFSKEGFDIEVSLAPAGQNPSPLVLGHGLVLDKAHFAISDQKGDGVQMSLGGEMTTPNPLKSGDELIFDVEGDLNSKNHTAKFVGVCRDPNATLAVSVGHAGLEVTSLSVEVDVAWDQQQGSHSATGAIIAGVLSIGHAHLTLELDLFASGISFTATLQEDPPLTLGALVDELCGEDVLKALSLPSSVRNDIANAWAFDELQLAIKTSPPSVTGAGAMTLFGFVGLRIAVTVSEQSSGPNAGDWGFMFGVEVDDNATFSNVLPSVPSVVKSVIDDLPMGSMAVVVSSIPGTMSFPGVPVPYQVDHGFNFFASLALSGSGHQFSKGLGAIAKWVGVQQLTVKAVIESAEQFSIHADAQGDLSLWHVVDVTAGGVFINVLPAEVQLGLEVNCLVHLDKLPQDQLPFHGDFFVSELGMGFDVAMTDDWVNPLGIDGVTISKSDLSLEISWSLVPNMIGIAGGLHIGGVGGDAAVWINENNFMVYGELDNINLKDIMDNMLKALHLGTPPKLVQTVADVSFKMVKVYMNTAPSAIVFNNQTYPPGYDFEIDELDMWEIIRGSARVYIGSDGFLLNATLQPISLCGGAIVLSGAHSHDEPAKLLLQLMPSNSMEVLDISAGIDILGEYLDVAAEVSDEAMYLYIDLSLFGDLFHFTLDAHSEGPVSAPTDFSIAANISNELQDYLENEVPKKLDEEKSALDKDIDSAKADIQQKEQQLSSIQNDIDQLKAEDQAAMSDAEKKLADAQAAVESAKHHVDELQNQIDDIKQKMDNLPWYEKWKDVGYAAELAALYIAKGTADVALDAANAILEVAKEAVDHVQDLDPRVVAKEAEYGVLHAAYDVAIAALNAAESLSDDVINLIEDVVKWQGKVFNIEELDISGSLQQLKSGQLAHVHLKGVFAGHAVDVTFDVTINDVISWVERAWKAVLHAITHKNGGDGVMHIGVYPTSTSDIYGNAHLHMSGEEAQAYLREQQDYWNNYKQSKRLLRA